ncbi:MAG TPA: hypothetical protein VLS53_03650 [Candidatus Dormibacteraeota bacterium]|nr:hypothetical protein [Candidatus Dormibacteraeota bacterium]
MPSAIKTRPPTRPRGRDRYGGGCPGTCGDGVDDVDVDVDVDDEGGVAIAM